MRERGNKIFNLSCLLIFRSRIEFKDNQEILDLLGQKPLNIISLIDEESRFPKVRPPTKPEREREGEEGEQNITEGWKGRGGRMKFKATLLYMTEWGGFPLTMTYTYLRKLYLIIIIIINLKGTDDSMLDKLHKQHSKHPHYIKPKSQARRAFGIVHFAGVVYYDADEFLEKNRDTFSADLFDLLHTSKSKFLTQLFKGERAMVIRE